MNFVAKKSWWWITAKNYSTREIKTRLVQISGPMLLEKDLEYYVPTNKGLVLELKLQHLEYGYA